MKLGSIIAKAQLCYNLGGKKKEERTGSGKKKANTGRTATIFSSWVLFSLFSTYKLLCESLIVLYIMMQWSIQEEVWFKE